ncbi:hypothetical protein [Corynebacterium sp. HMSC11E11]|uniref:hypothetical protein n=1 Tax=Corynebacterium sp. HMSC11E11 TaxID=1581089 RepID=UPI0008A60A1A|nr:hypothetical protein [Corynebacterium sp. HMSC11E11]
MTAVPSRGGGFVVCARRTRRPNRLIVEAAYRTRGRKSAGPSGHEIDDRPADDVRRVLEAPSRGEEGWWEPAAATGE